MQYTRLRPAQSSFLQGTRTVNGILEKFERHDIADREVVERDALLPIASAKIGLAILLRFG